MSLSTRITAAAALAGIFTLSPAIRPAVAADASFHGLNAALGEGASAIPCARAVRRVLPSGWRIQGEQALLGCAPVSWDATDTALSVYQRIAGESGLSIIADIADETIAIGRPAGGASDSRSGSMTAAGPTAFVGTSVR
ncbi:MAG TPA: hypothetical protein VHB77_12250, partial [Planctomycetaceae bacterium]|nr:hypothetical protein [Planctomycetaceae bacterium]